MVNISKPVAFSSIRTNFKRSPHARFQSVSEGMIDGKLDKDGMNDGIVDGFVLGFKLGCVLIVGASVIGSGVGI